jgi:hypothetical protein
MTPSRQRRLFPVLLFAGLLAGCTTAPTSSNVKGVGGNAVNIVSKTATSVIGGPIIPDTSISLGPSVSYPLEKIVYWGAYAAAAWLILDPLAPNWEIEEARFPKDHVHLQLSMKRYYAGGAGEARAAFHRRAKQMVRDGNFTSYEVVEYSEGMDSSVLGSQRKAEGVIRLTKAAG